MYSKVIKRGLFGGRPKTRRASAFFTTTESARKPQMDAIVAFGLVCVGMAVGKIDLVASN